MFRMTLVLAIVVACKEKPADQMGATPGQSGAMGTSGAMGSAMGTEMPPNVVDAALSDAPPPVDAAPAPKTADDIAKQFEQCLHLPEQNRTDAYRACFAPGAKREVVGVSAASEDFFDAHTKETAQLVLIHGHDVIALVLAEMPKPVLVGRIQHFDDQGRFTGIRDFFDAKKPGKELAQKESLISKGDDNEKANLAAYAKLGKSASETWAAGTYVAAVEKRGAKTVLAIYRFAGGKPEQTWVLP